MASTAPATNILNGYPIRNYDTADTGAVALANEIQGGHHQVALLTDRDAITTERRQIGMTCYVGETGFTYVLKTGIANTDWILYSTGGSAGFLTKNKAAWLFRNANRAANWAGWQPIMATPPALSTNLASQIAGGVLFNAVTAPQNFTFLSAKFIEGGQDGTGGNPGFYYSRGVTGSFLSMPNAVEFYTDANEFEIVSFPTGAANLQLGTRLWVDGKLASINQIPTRSYDGVNLAYDRVIFGAVVAPTVTRLIRLEFFSVPWKGIIVPAANKIWTDPIRRKPRVIAVTDSFGQPTGQGNGNVWRGYLGLLASKFDWDLWASGAGGTGYSNPNTVNGQFKAIDRLQADVISNAPDMVIFELGINDSSPTYLATLAADVEATYALIDDSLPGMPVAVLGPVWPTASPTADLLSVRLIIKAAAEKHGYWFIDPTDPAAQWITSNNKQSYHPTTAAAGTTTLGGGGIASTTVTNGGRGYFSVPTATLVGGTGSGGVVQPLIDGRIMSCTLLNQGRGYDGTTTVTFEGGGGTGAAAVPVISGGKITGITMTSVGTGYTLPPRVIISGIMGAGGAVAVSALEYIVTGFEVLTPGSYTVAPTITVPAASDGTHPNLFGHGFYAEKLAWELWSRAQAARFTVNPPAPATGAGEALAWQTRAIAAGGTVSAATLANVGDLVLDLKKAGVWTKIDWMWAAAGDYAAALVPIKVGHGAGALTPIAITGADYSETGATAGFKGDGTTKYLDTGYNTSTAGLSLTDAHVMNTVKGVESAGTSRWSMGNATAATPSNCTGFGWLTGGTIDVGCIASYGVGGGPSPSPGTGAKEGVLIIAANGSRSGDYYDDGTLVPSSVNMGANAYANCNIFLLSRNVNGTSDANKSTRYMRAAAIGQGITATQAAGYAAAVTSFGSKMGWA